MKDLGVVNYTDKLPPLDYRCDICGAYNCKLWRRYQVFLDDNTLLCVTCAGKDQDKDVSDVDEQGMTTSVAGFKHDSIGWLVPAIPTEDGTTYWGYSSVPGMGVSWWYQLPSKPNGK